MRGYVHLTTADAAASRRFWAGTLGAEPVEAGDTPSFRMSNCRLIAARGAPAGGSKGTTINHIGFQVPDLRAALARIRAAGAPFVTRDELSAAFEVRDGVAFIENQQAFVAFTMSPDLVKVELIEARGMHGTIAFHHVHFAAPDVDAMRAWYVHAFGGVPGQRGSFQTADVGAVNLTFSPAAAPIAGTLGRAIDRIGFEAANLASVCRALDGRGVQWTRSEAHDGARPMTMVRLADPWGTAIELTESTQPLI
jgi:catechol 2,3-dioxygenase-like lactoylglutathione lyase family enzyme